MDKVGIITVYNACNYGSFLQAFALRSFLIANGYSVDFQKIDVEYSDVTSAGAGEEYTRYEAAKYEKLVTDQKCFSIVDSVDESYKCCVIGSDTVWNMFDPTYEKILYFVGKDISCRNIISYAASVGQIRLSKILIMKGLKLLPIRKLNRISVRDDKTELIIKLFGKKPVRVLDPTFLYDFQTKMPENVPQQPFLLVYTYGFSDKEIAAVKKIAKQRKLLIVATGSLCSWADVNLVVGSFEWLWLVKNAEIVITGTFHGSVFSIKYNKAFAVLTEGSDKVYSLLSEFGLCHRIASVETLEDVLTNNIDYNEVNKIIREKQIQSKKFLLNAVKGK